MQNGKVCRSYPEIKVDSEFGTADPAGFPTASTAKPATWFEYSKKQPLSRDRGRISLSKKLRFAKFDSLEG